jgi:nitrite reductase (NADH) small subunit
MQSATQNAVVWQDVCSTSDLVDNSGVCALINAEQVAIFKVVDRGVSHVFALANWDPIGKANVLYRGILGSIGDEYMVASPLYKQHYSLLDGHCFDDDAVSVATYEVKIINDRVFIGS